MAIESLAEFVRLAPDTYAFRWQNHVALFIVTDGGVVLCDPIGWTNARTPGVRPRPGPTAMTSAPNSSTGAIAASVTQTDSSSGSASVMN